MRTIEQRISALEQSLSAMQSILERLNAESIWTCRSEDAGDRISILEHSVEALINESDTLQTIRQQESGLQLKEEIQKELLKKIIEFPLKKITTDELRALKVGGRDQYSALNHGELSYLLTSQNKQRYKKEIDKQLKESPQYQRTAYRWVLRGMSADKAICKTLTDVEENSKNKKLKEEEKKVKTKAQKNALRLRNKNKKQLEKLC